MMTASQATKKMNPTPTVTVATVTMKCTPEYPKRGPLNSLHDMAYYKKIVVSYCVKCIPSVLWWLLSNFIELY